MHILPGRPTGKPDQMSPIRAAVPIDQRVRSVHLVVKSASSAASNALWLTERGTRLQARDVADRFGFYRDELGLDPALSPHCLRHSYVTHLIEDGVDPRFVQEQAGHVYQSTTGLYTAVSGDFKNKMLHDAIRAVLPTNPGGQRQ